MAHLSDIEIARQADKKPIQEIGAGLGIPPEHLLPFGHDKAKVSAAFIASLDGRPDGKLILVTAINPTPAGEGKTTTTVGLGDGLNAIGKQAVICLREPSLGPCFGMKGGAAGGGYAQVVPMEDINLHFTGDFHAITAAHNLLSAMIDNHIYWGNALDIDPRRVAWRRVMDMNDRALREIVCSLGGVANGYPREGGFDITVASEVMAILCLATDLADLERRLGDIIVAYTRDRQPVHARDLKADGAMAVLLAQAMQPNLVQTLENNPAFVHGGPFANIAHGCNSVIATQDGAEARRLRGDRGRLRRRPRGGEVLRHQVPQGRAAPGRGGDRRDGAGAEDERRREEGGARRRERRGGAQGLRQPRAAHRQRQVVRGAGGGGDQPLRHRHRGRDRGGARSSSRAHGTEAILCRHWAEGSKGIAELATRVAQIAESGAVAVRRALSRRDAAVPQDRGRSPSASTTPTRCWPTPASASSCTPGRRPATATCRSAWPRPSTRSRPTRTCAARRPGFGVPIREVRLAAGAGFIVAICGEIMTMPGLPRAPSAEAIRLNEAGLIEGLF